ncbi:HAD hydrolase family protein [Bacillus velezensis]|nr:HAD hydrolase family protein [Bacillus velezensis]
MGMGDEECAAFGDSGNDLEMVSAVKYGVAMDNAQESIKQAPRISRNQTMKKGS